MKAFYNITTAIEDYLAANPNVHSVTIGDISEIDLNKQSIYPLSHIIMGNVTFGEATIYFDVDVLFVDSVYEPQNEVKDEVKPFIGTNNLQDVMNTQLAVANGLQSTLRRGTLRANNYVLTGDPIVTPFQDRFTTLVAGWNMSFRIEVPNIDINTCEYTG